MMSEKASQAFAIASYIALGMFAGAIGYIQRQFSNNKPIGKWHVLVEALGAGLVGYLLMLVCMELGLSPNWTGTIVGTGGWLGASATIRIIERYVFRKLGVTNDDLDRADGTLENKRREEDDTP